jgi:hypothetical protein
VWLLLALALLSNLACSTAQGTTNRMPAPVLDEDIDPSDEAAEAVAAISTPGPGGMNPAAVDAGSSVITC